MGAVQSMSTAIGLDERLVVIGHEPDGHEDVDAALLEAGATLMAHHEDAPPVSNPRVACDAVVLVIPSIDGQVCETLKALRSTHSTIALVVVARSASRGSVAAAIQAGAGAIVLRTQIGTALAPALRAARAGLICIPRELSTGVTRPILTTREKQILAMLVLGFSNAEIARKLHVAESTVKSHLSGAFAKLGVRSRNEAVAAILDPVNGLGTGILAISSQEVHA
jgi:DNA-binding NarL/FixJ family response regulator